jgi:hypothetical protein
LITPLFTTDQLSQILIVGNASGEWQPLKQGLSFIFNGTQVNGVETEADIKTEIEAGLAPATFSTAPTANNPKSAIINIANGGYAKTDAPFVVQSQSLNQHQCQLLTVGLDNVAQSLQNRLNCWPSSGLTCFMLMSQFAPVQVSRMSLLPSLARSPDMTLDDHLPCVVHNWLGERRLALEHIANDKISPALNQNKDTINQGDKAELTSKNRYDISWPELRLPHQPSAVDTRTVNMPFFQLHAIANAVPNTRTQYQQSLQQLNTLSQLHAQQWQGALSPEQLQQALIASEALFFDQSLQQHPSMRPDNAHTLMRYWYLSDNPASQYLDAIRQQLALCQQRLSLG